VARHRSPQSRRPRRQPAAAVTRRAAGPGAWRAALTAPVRRGASAVAVAGGALSLVAAAAPLDEPAAGSGTAADDGTAAGPEGAVLRLSGASAGPPGLAPGQVPGSPQVVPVVLATDVVDATDLVEAVQRAEESRARAEAEARAAAEAAREREEAERRAAEEAAQEAERRAALGCDLDTSGLGPVQSWVADAAQFLGCQFGRPPMLGVGSRGNASDHPSGRALDLMTSGSTGDAIAACALENMDALGITYVIWEQRINTGSGWETMEDRGSATANHMDHVHISFNSSGGSGDPTPC